MDVVVWKEETAYKIALGIYCFFVFISLLSLDPFRIGYVSGTVLIPCFILYLFLLGLIKFRNYRQRIKKN